MWQCGQDHSLPLPVDRATGGWRAAADRLCAGQSAVHDGSAGGSFADPRPIGERVGRVPHRLGLSGRRGPLHHVGRLHRGLSRRVRRSDLEVAPARCAQRARRLSGRGFERVLFGTASGACAKSDHHGDSSRFSYPGGPAIEVGGQDRYRGLGRRRQRLGRCVESAVLGTDAVSADASEVRGPADGKPGSGAAREFHARGEMDLRQPGPGGRGVPRVRALVLPGEPPRAEAARDRRPRRRSARSQDADIESDRQARSSGAPDASAALQRLVGSEDYTALEFDLGHIGMYISARAQREVPEAIADWLSAR